MQQKKTPQQELDRLEQLIVNECGEEHPDSIYLKQLCCKYPYQYVQFMKKHGRLDAPPDTGLLTKAFIVAFRLTNEYYWKLQHYLVSPPQTEEQKAIFRNVVEKLEPMIRQQTKEN